MVGVCGGKVIGTGLRRSGPAQHGMDRENIRGGKDVRLVRRPSMRRLVGVFGAVRAADREI